MFGFRGSVERGVKAGLEKSFGPGGGFDKALREGLKPVAQELERLRAIEFRYRWHPIEKIPEWAKDGREILVSVAGDLMWASYVNEPGEEPYWDADIEYGGSPVEPDFFFILPKVPAAKTPEERASEHLASLPKEGE